MAAALQYVVQHIKATEPELRRRGIVHLSLFGSLVRGEAREDSDIDVAVEIEAGRSFSLIRMEDTRLLLEDVLGRPVDLGEIASFRPTVRAAFEQDQVRVF
jgi:predicted nucleotidyltransferase